MVLPLLYRVAFSVIRVVSYVWTDGRKWRLWCALCSDTKTFERYRGRCGCRRA